MNGVLFFDVESQSEHFVKQHLNLKRLDLIRDCILAAVQTYNDDYEGLNVIHSARTKASTINDHIVNNIKNAFQDDPDVHFVYKRQSFRACVENGAVNIRFKKMDKKMRVHSIPTQQALAFNCQGVLFEPSVNINAGYVSDGLDIKIVLACPQNSNKNYWKWELPRKLHRTSKIAAIIPIPGANITTRTVKPRRELIKNEETQND